MPGRDNLRQSAPPSTTTTTTATLRCYAAGKSRRWFLTAHPCFVASLTFIRRLAAERHFDFEAGEAFTRLLASRGAIDVTVPRAYIRQALKLNCMASTSATAAPVRVLFVYDQRFLVVHVCLK